MEAEGTPAWQDNAALLVKSAPIDEAVEVGGLVFHKHTLSPLDDSVLPRLTMNAYHSGPVTLGMIHYSAGARVSTGSVRDGYQVNLPIGGELKTGRPDEFVLATPQVAAVYGLNEHFFEGFETSMKMLGIKFDRATLEHRMEQLLGRSLVGEELKFQLAMTLNTPESREWLDILQILNRRLRTNAELSANPLVFANLQDALMTSFLLNSNHNFTLELADVGSQANPQTVKRVVSYIESHPDSALLSIPELAELAGVSVRSLQTGFRKTMDTTPLEYLRARRLNGAYRDLELSDAATTRVIDIAERWGFAHHGRFAIEYKQKFGESPSQTLKR
jgi:AraC-like DNA-binding protein